MRHKAASSARLRVPGGLLALIVVLALYAFAPAAVPAGPAPRLANPALANPALANIAWAQADLGTSKGHLFDL